MVKQLVKKDNKPSKQFKWIKTFWGKQIVHTVDNIMKKLKSRGNNIWNKNKKKTVWGATILNCIDIYNLKEIQAKKKKKKGKLWVQYRTEILKYPFAKRMPQRAENDYPTSHTSLPIFNSFSNKILLIII